MTTAIGLDVGGSKIAACLFDVGRRIVVESAHAPTNASRGGLAVLDDCVNLVSRLSNGTDRDPSEVPVGIGVCELVDPVGGITSAATVDWRDVDLASAFAGHPIVVDSDVRAAALAEARLGAGAGHRNFVYLTLGTGISFSLVLDGVPYQGARGNALILGAPPVEGTSSGAALARLGGADSAEAVFASDELEEIVRHGGDRLGRAMAWLVNALDPEIVVVGGGLGLRRDYRLAATAEMRAHIEADNARDVDVVPAALGHESGAIGAALMAAEAVSSDG